MERGIYIDGDSYVLYFGNRKPVDPGGLTWVKLNIYPGDLKKLGISAWKWDGAKIIQNPELPEKAAEKEAEDQRLAEIEADQNASGIKNVSVAQAHAKIDQLFVDKTTSAQIRTATIKAFKLIVIFILR